MSESVRLRARIRNAYSHFDSTTRTQRVCVEHPLSLRFFIFFIPCVVQPKYYLAFECQRNRRQSAPTPTSTEGTFLYNPLQGGELFGPFMFESSEPAVTVSRAAHSSAGGRTTNSLLSKRPQRHLARCVSASARQSLAMAEEKTPFWFTVQYGEAQNAIFNADCWANVLCDYMKERCGYGEAFEEPVDLLKADDNAQINLRDQERTNASEILVSRGTYILCKVYPTDDGTPPTYEPLLAGMDVAPPAAPAGKKK